MKILFLGNESSEELVNYLVKLNEVVTFTSERVTIEQIKAILPELIISYNYRYIIKNDIIEEYKGKIINLHISYLPWNRGAQPNFWSVWDGTPKGVSIHYIDEGIDTGEIIAQREIDIKEDETLRGSYDRLHSEILSLFKEEWINIKNGKCSPIPQTHRGTFHQKKDLELIWSHIEAQGGWDIKISDLIRIRSQFL